MQISATALCSGFDIAFGITQLTIASIGVANDVYCGTYECVTLVRSFFILFTSLQRFSHAYSSV